MSGKFLNDAELDEHWNWYQDWLCDDDEYPELDEEDHETICNIIEELFQHICNQQKVIACFEGE
jgi:hypothetical protein